MGSNYTEYYVQLINRRTKASINDDTGKYIVMTASSPVLATIYTDSGGTAATIAATGAAQTMTDGIIRFWTASSVTSVDVSFLTAAGQSGFIAALTSSQHRFEVETEERQQILIYPYYNYLPTPFISASVTQTGSAWCPGFSLQANMYVKDAWVRTYTLGTTSTINFGVSGTPSGLVQGVTAAVTGIHYPFIPEVTAGTATFTRGTLLQASLTNLNVTRYMPSAATGLVWYNTTVTVLAAECGWVYLSYDKMPV